ncbi:c-type cytochrome [Palleronia pelagia]|uniref:Cytochrome c n=1 Tax=Palleronia pelagia TaxID=387096 RepID=A0A1H8LNN9_9RHOB|nr:c-type cytochrome [Palleronia pelagia]SEO06643.1 Cytochrome c [Palleronia pelagia]
MMLALVCATGVSAEDVAPIDALLEIEGDVAYGEYLATECTACHGGGGRIPPLAGLPREYMLSALHDYKSGVRENATMKNVAMALGDDEMAALAAFFETETP